MRVTAGGKLLHRPYGKIIAGLAIWPFLILFIIADNKSFSFAHNLISPTSSFKPIVEEIVNFKEDSSFTYLTFVMAKALREDHGLKRLTRELAKYKGICGVEKQNGFYVTYEHEKSNAPVVLHFFRHKKMAKSGVYFSLPRETRTKGFVEILAWEAYERVEKEEHAAIRAFFSPEGGCEREIIEAIRGAKDTLDIAIYSFNNVRIAEALTDAWQRGVKVRLLMDTSQRNSDVVKQLKKGNIVPLFDNRRRGLMHNKFMIVDKRRVFTGSYNWTDDAESMNRENLIILPYLYSFQREFMSLWYGMPHLPAHARSPPDPIEAYFSPKGACEDAIVALIRKTWQPREIEDELQPAKKKSIRAALYFFTNKRIAKELFDAKEHGIDITLILDKCQRNRKDSAVRYLEQLEKEARARDAKKGVRTVGRGSLTIGYHRIEGVIMHNKFAAIGETTVTGSFNWTQSAEKYNGDNLVVVPSLMKEFVAEFDKLWREIFDTVVIDAGKIPPYIPRGPPESISDYIVEGSIPCPGIRLTGKDEKEIENFKNKEYEMRQATEDLTVYRVFDNLGWFRDGTSYPCGGYQTKEEYITDPAHTIMTLGLFTDEGVIYNKARFREKVVLKENCLFAYGWEELGNALQTYIPHIYRPKKRWWWNSAVYFDIDTIEEYIDGQWQSISRLKKILIKVLHIWQSILYNLTYA